MSAADIPALAAENNELSLSAVRPGLYLSGVTPAQDLALLKASCISSVLAVGSHFEPLFPEDLCYKVVQVDDVATENLLVLLEQCCDFIDQCRKNDGSVLVHCVAGVSRSASVVLAYLMRTETMTLQTAMEALTAVRPAVGPNPGFTYQLRLWEAMGMKMDPQHAAYREFRIQLLASQKTGNKNPFTAFIADPSNVSIASARGGAPTVAMRCGKCRTLLFRGRCRIPHAPKPNCAMTYHIEPMAWIPGLDGGKLADKIVCPTPKCGAKLGAWTWGAESCTCGTMTTPSFAIQTRKVDTTIIPSDQAVRKSVIQAQALPREVHKTQTAPLLAAE